MLFHESLQSGSDALENKDFIFSRSFRTQRWNLISFVSVFFIIIFILLAKSIGLVVER